MLGSSYIDPKNDERWFNESNVIINYQYGFEATAWEAMGNISSSAEGKSDTSEGELDVWIKTIRARNNITGLTSLKFRSSLSL